MLPNNRYHGEQAARARERILDVLKGICIIFVIITHYKWTPQEELRYLFPFWIDMAVPVFMIISGYTYCKSFLRHNIETFEQAFDIRFVLKKALRYSLPFWVADIINETAWFILSPEKHSIYDIFFTFFNGGIGPGSYYYPVIMQLIFYFPCLYFIVKKHKFRGLLLCGAINFAYEFLQTAYGMNEELYRLLVFRYTLVIAFGIYMAICDRPINKKLTIISLLSGIAYIILFCYMGFTPFITRYWTGTSFLACLFILPITFFVIKHIKWKCAPLELLGKASYNIFLVQMVYFNGASFLYAIVENKIFQLILNLCICIFIGILFYWIETPITKKITRSILHLLHTRTKNDPA